MLKLNKTIQRANVWRLLKSWPVLLLLLLLSQRAMNTRAVRKESVHYEYLENRSRDLDVTWQPVRADLTVYPWTVTLPWGLVRRQWDAVDWACVLCYCRIQNDRASGSAASRQCACPFYSCRAGFLGKHHIIQVCQTPTAQIWLPATSGFSPKLKSPLKMRRFVNVTVTHYTSPVNGVSLPTD